MAQIKMQQLSKWYGEVIGVSNISADISTGVTGLLGPNGSGKTTLFKLLTGLVKADTGDAKIDNERIWDNPEIYKTVGYCPSLERFYENMTGHEFLTYMARLNGMNKANAQKRALECLERMALSDAAHKAIGAYSKGMRQRVKFAQAILHEPSVIFLDEPLSGMDPIGRQQTVQLIREYGAMGKTVVVSSHILHEVEEMTKRILLLNNGMLLAEGEVYEIRELIEEQPRHVRIRCPERRQLSNALVQYPEVQTLTFDEEPDDLIVQTTSPDSFFNRLNELVLEDEMPIHSIETLDDNLQSVFDYLVK